MSISFLSGCISEARGGLKGAFKSFVYLLARTVTCKFNSPGSCDKRILFDAFQIDNNDDNSELDISYSRKKSLRPVTKHQARARSRKHTSRTLPWLSKALFLGRLTSCTILFRDRGNTLFKYLLFNSKVSSNINNHHTTIHSHRLTWHNSRNKGMPSSNITSPRCRLLKRKRTSQP